MIQITPQMRILVAVAPVDFRVEKGVTPILLPFTGQRITRFF